MQAVLVSGGLDSTTLLYYVWTRYRDKDKVVAISFDYGQRHRKELEYVKYHVEKLGVEWVKLYLPRMPKSRALDATDKDEVPDGVYTPEAIEKLVSPYRNLIMIAIAAAYVAKHGGGQVWYAAHTNDWAVYPDCRPQFVDAMNQVLKVGHTRPVALQAPFVGIKKSDIVRIGVKLGVDYRRTWSCYRGGEKHCGRCPTCIDRKLAFKEAGVEDPTEYEVDDGVGSR